MKWKRSLAVLLPVCLMLCACPSALAAPSAAQAAEAVLEVAAAGKTAAEEAAVQIRAAGAAERIRLAEAAVERTPAVKREYVDETGTTQAAWEQTFCNVPVKTSQSSCVYVDLTVDLWEDADNKTGFQIEGIQTVAVTGKEGYVYVSGSDITVVDCAYGDGAQTAVLTIQFRVRTDSLDHITYDQGVAKISLL